MESVGEFEYSTKDLIGHGAFAVVFKGRHKKNHSFTVAVKSITKKNLSKSQNLLGKEIKILKELTELHHENVVALLDCKETAHHVNLVMEYCNGGDLADYLNAMGTLSEDTIRLFLRQIAGAMRALNAKGIVHRDLKPQNILLCNSGLKTSGNSTPKDIKLKIADFGFARFLQDGVMAATLCGSPMYMAPEVIMSLQYDAKADLWSIGTIVFQCLTGKAPFQAQTPQALKQFYEKNARLAPKIPNGTSKDLTDLLLRMLKRNAKDRLEFDEFFNHPFLKKQKSSSPVAVPSNQRGRSHSSSRSPSSPVAIPSRRSYSSFGGDASPVQSPMMGALPEVVENDSSARRDFARMLTDSETTKPAASSPPDEQDFVVVPSNLASDNSSDSSPCCGRTNRKRSFEAGSMAPCADFVAVGEPTSESPRPTYLPVTATTGTQRPTNNSAALNRQQSLPIPVPSQKEAYLQLTNQNSVDTNSSSSSKHSSQSPVSPRKSSIPRSEPIRMRRRSSTGASSGDISSLSPPSVQFAIGTPPSSARRRCSATPSPVMGGRQTPEAGQRYSTGATPPSTGSPLRRFSNASPPHMNSQCMSAASGLPTILGSPTKITASYDIMGNQTNVVTVAAGYGVADNQQPHHMLMPFCTRAQTLPELCGCGATNQNLIDQDLIHKSGSVGRLSDRILGIHNPHSNVVIPWSSGNVPMHAGCNNPTHQPVSTTTASAVVASNHRLSMGNTGGGMYDSCCSNPPGIVPFGTSPPNMEGPIMFVAPELPEETILEKEHTETLAKLNFVLALVDCIIELAKTKAMPIAVLTESICRNENTSSDGYRKAEQLVLYMRLLQMLSSSLNLSQKEIKNRRLQPSTSVRHVLSKMNEKFRFCLNMCKVLHSPGVLQSAGVDPQSSLITADKLIYNYAIEMCQTAALDELFGNPHECFKRYRTAQIMLHSLSQQICNEQDKRLLIKYKEAVEKRLYVLQSQGFQVYAYDTT